MLTVSIIAFAIVAWVGLLPGICDEVASPLGRVAVFLTVGCMYGFVAMMLANFI